MICPNDKFACAYGMLPCKTSSNRWTIILLSLIMFCQAAKSVVKTIATQAHHVNIYQLSFMQRPQLHAHLPHARDHAVSSCKVSKSRVTNLSNQNLNLKCVHATSNTNGPEVDGCAQALHTQCINADMHHMSLHCSIAGAGTSRTVPTKKVTKAIECRPKHAVIHTILQYYTQVGNQPATSVTCHNVWI